MALNLKYFARYRDIDGVIKEIRFLKEGYEGPNIEWFCTDGAVDFNYAGFDKMFEQPIIPSQATIKFHLTTAVDLREFVFNRKTFFCEIYNTDTSSTQWSGWIEPWGATRPHKKAPWNVQFIASCGLTHLSRKKYINSTNIFKKTGLAIIQECLATIGAGQKIRISTHMVETTWGGDDRLGLNCFEINTSRYYDQNGEAMYCDVIVNDILNHFNAEILQWDNRWVIRAIVDNAANLATGYIDIDDPGAPANMPFSYEINAEGGSATMDGGNVSILPPKNKYRTEIDFGTQVPFFENGNMVLWNDGGLIGWDFTHMAKSTTNGWERFEVGGEVSRGVLKINGKSPNPIRKKKPIKKKNKFLKRLLVIPLIVDAIKLVGKDSWMDVEPTEYIESPGGTIGKGDKSVTVTFDYETEAFSSDILISIRIPVTLASGKIVNYWVDPSTHPALAGADKTTAGATENFCLIRIPAVDMGSLTDKGLLDVSGNPNYPPANYPPGGKNINWTWTATGVPTGEYRRVGGPAGVLVENGDLIIARIPNLGGTQAAVGGSWEIIGIRNNIKKGSFSLTVSLNTTFITTAGHDFPADKIYIRFYKMADDEGLPGDWYKVYNVNGALEGFIAKEESAKYATILQRGSSADVTDEEAETINLITGDYTPWYAGSWTKPGSIENTRTWRRRPDLNEAMGVYRAMMLDRLCLTSRPLTVVEGTIWLAPGAEPLSILHTLLMMDMGGMRMRMTRFSFNDYERRIKFTATEVNYEEIPSGELKQDAYIPGSRQLNTVPGQGDGIYPSKQDSSSGRLNAEDMPLTEEELYAALEGARQGALFEGVPPLVYVAGELSTDSVDMNEYLSEIAIYNNENQEEEDIIDLNLLRWTTLKKPSWVTAQSVVYMNVSVTGKPIYVGADSITFRVRDPEDDRTDEEIQEEIDEIEANGGEIAPESPFYVDVVIPIIVYPKTKVTYTLLDTSGTTPVRVGSLPGSWPLPAMWNIEIKILGPHDFYQFRTVGGGPTGSEIDLITNEEVNFANSGTYMMFEGDGIVTEAGLFRTYALTQIEKSNVHNENINFILYDDEFENLCKFFITKAAADISPISADGTSQFLDPATWDNRVLIADTSHDKAILRLNADDGSVIKERIVTHGAPVTNQSYFVYGADESHPIGEYNVSVNLYLGADEVFMRYADFETVKQKPTAEGGSLKLVTKESTSKVFREIATLPASGYSTALPSTGYSVLADAESEPFDWQGHEDYLFKGGKLVLVDTAKGTGIPPYISYPDPVTQADYYIYDDLTSLSIPGIPNADHTKRTVVTRKIGGISGEPVAVYSADYSFGPLVDISEAEEGAPTSSLTDFMARYGLGEEIIDSIKYFDARVDDLTIEVKNPTVITDNYLQVKEKGILFKHIQDVGTKTLLGRLTAGTGPVSAITVVDAITTAIGDVIPSDLAVKDYVTTQLAGFLPNRNYVDDWNLVNVAAISKFNTSSVNNPQGGATIHHGLFMIHGNPGDANYGTSIAFRNNRGFFRSIEAGVWQPWLEFASREWVALNYVPLTRTVTAGNGMTGGGALSANITLTMGTPSTINSLTSNSASAGTHTHQIFTGNLIQGTNVTLTGDITNRLVDGGDVTISIPTYPWANLTGYVSVLAGVGMTGGGALSGSVTLTMGTPSTINSLTSNSVSGTTHTHQIFTGNLIQGTNMTLTGDLTNRLVDGGDVTIAITSFPWASLTGHVSLSAGVGLTGGGVLSTSQSVALGTPSTINSLTSNSVSGTTHTHQIFTGNLIQGSNVVLTGDLTNRLVDGGDVTISITATPWSIITSKPTTISGFGIVDAPTITDLTTGLATKENTFSKGDLVQGNGMSMTGTLTSRLVGTGSVTIAMGTPSVINSLTVNSVSGSTHTHEIYTGNLVQGSNVSLSGDLTNRLVDGGDVTIAITAFPWSGITGKPTTRSGYGLTDVYTQSEVDALIAPAVVGPGTNGYFAKFVGAYAVGNSTVQDTGTEVNFASSRSLGVEGPAAMRDYLHVWGYASFGTASNHGTLVIHNLTTATIDGCAALEIRSTTKGVIFPRMTRAQRLSISSPTDSLMVFQTDTVGASLAGFKQFQFGIWVHIDANVTNA